MSKTQFPTDLDLRLKTGSAAINSGARLPGINDDFKGDAPDLGAYELGDRTSALRAALIFNYRGTSTFSRASSMRLSLRTPPYLALVSRAMRCAKTGRAKACTSSGET